MMDIRQETARLALPSDAIRTLGQQLHGTLILPDDARYDTARRVYNAMHDCHPALIVEAANVADVISAVTFARQQGIDLAVRGGAHSVPGFGTCDGGMVLSLERLRGIRVDPEHRCARAEGGCTWADLNHACAAFGLATTGGIVSTTGIAGLTLGGGFGFLARRYGLACDNLLSADVVTADGDFLTCSDSQHAELFWAIRGGGGNFGVVTSFEYRLHAVSDILGGPTFYPLEADVMRHYQEWIVAAPEALGAILGVTLGPPLSCLPEEWHGQPVIVVLTCWSGSPDEDAVVREQLAHLGPVLGQAVQRMPYPGINTLFDELLPAGLYHYWKGCFSRELTDEAIAEHIEHGAHTPCLESAMLLFPLDGACQRVADNATAFPYRDASFATVVSASWPDPADNEHNIAWARAYFQALKPHSEEGGYVNFMSADDAGRVRANYRQHYARLAVIKHRHDPTNLFHLNQNIEPCGGTPA
ncbi:FAD-binding oxidoreductase [Billgrantia montanilacus]|nr:FAD-binding oxidoreductase [Halomonas montanilacus]